MGSSFGCDQGAPAPQSFAGPPPHVVWTYPANEAMDVPRTFAIRVQFDRFLMPSTAVRQTLCLQAATVGGEATGTDRCDPAGIAPEYDPVDRVATWVIRGELMPLTRYNVRLFAPKNPQDPNGVRAFDGAPLEKEFTFAFTTGQASPGLEPPRKLGFCDMRQLCPLPDGACDGPMPVGVTTSPHAFLTGNCTSGGTCHGGGGGNTGPAGSVLRLDDDGAGGGIVAAVRHLVDDAVVARETATGVDPVAPSRNVLTPFGHNMPYIDATNPGNSFLLYKLILAMAPRCPFDPEEESATHNGLVCADPNWRYAQDFYDCWAILGASTPRDPSGGCPFDAGFPASRDGSVPEHVAARIRSLLTRIGLKDDLIPPPLEQRVPPDAWQPPARGEYERLHARIRGSGMPEGGVVSHADALMMSAWIADGARVEVCP